LQAEWCTAIEALIDSEHSIEVEFTPEIYSGPGNAAVQVAFKSSPNTWYTPTSWTQTAINKMRYNYALSGLQSDDLWRVILIDPPTMPPIFPHQVARIES